MTTSADEQGIPLSFSDLCKRVFLGKPLITAELKSERLSNPVALGALSPDAISSTAYGPEQILTELLPHAGLAAFVLLLPIMGVILLILVLVAASYRQVVMAYTKAGGSYIVARENFGPRVAQVAAAALLIDYVVTVAVQAAAGTVAVVSALPALGPYSLGITVGVVIVICYLNLRGLREAGLPFAIATYSFVVMIAAMIVTGVVRHIFWGLTQYDPRPTPRNGASRPENGLVMGATILVVLRAFANGGSSLTGVEAISNTVTVFRKPQGVNARRVLTAMACILGFLLAGVGYLTYATHAFPYLKSEYPSVLSQVARAVFGNGVIGNTMYTLVQVSTAAILYTGANTSFNGFPALASFVAEDRFLPRQLMQRGYRLVFSNGIITLAALSVALLVSSGGSVNALVPFYAIGVFTGFSMAGYGMTKHHLTHREPGWRHKLAINLSAGILSTIVVGVFAVAKFWEGAWLVVVVFPLMVFGLIRLNREYRAETAILERFRTDRPELVKYARHKAFVFVNSVDLAVLEALRYGKGLRADELIAVHFVVDAQHAAKLRKRWDHFDFDTPLRVVDCPDRQLNRAAQMLVGKARDEQRDTNVTVLLPRRTYAPVLGRLLHDRSADRIAKAVSRMPDAAATIVPYDVQSRISDAFPDSVEQRIAREFEKVEARIREGDNQTVESFEHPERSSSVIAVNDLIPGRRATIEGRVTRGRGRHQRPENVPVDRGRRRQRRAPGQIPTGPRWRGYPARQPDTDHRKGTPERQGAGIDDGPGLSRDRPARGVVDGGKIVKKLIAVVGSLAGLVFTANGYRPLSKRGYPSMYAFSYGVFASELPLQVLGGEIAALAAITRWLSPRVRRFSWLVSGLSWLGLLGLHLIGRRSNVPMTAALDAALGADRRRDSDDLWKRPAGAGTAKSPGVIRMMRIYRDYAHDADLSYGEYGARNHLDIWRRPDLDRGGRAPVLLQVPGGAWMIGSKRQQAYPLMSHLAELGWVCVAINYRLSPRSTWPDHIVDVKRALAWTKEHIAEYGGDPDWIAITGGSAGGHLCALAALTANDPQFQPGFEEADTSVRAAVPFYGIYDFATADAAMHPLMTPMLAKYVFKLRRTETSKAFGAASPASYICPDAPPFFVLHGRNDSLVPVEQARGFTARLRDVSRQPVAYAELPFAQHAFDILGSVRAAHAAVAVEQFLAEVYASYHTGADGSIAGQPGENTSRTSGSDNDSDNNLSSRRTR